jgi:hypothetical protein
MRSAASIGCKIMDVLPRLQNVATRNVDRTLGSRWIEHFVTVNVCLSVIYCFFIPWKISPFVRLSLQQLLDSSKTVIGGSEDSSSCEPLKMGG